MKITKKHLIGEISDFPIEVVEKMVSEQVKQGNLPNPTIFALKNSASYCEGGFTWDVAKDGHYFWEDVIRMKNFDVFFKKYPKTSKVESNTTKLVYAIGVLGNGENVIKALEKHGGINAQGHYGDEPTYLYYIDPETNHIEICTDCECEKSLRKVLEATYTRIEIEDPIVEVSMEDIAKMMGVDMSKLRIKG